MKLTRFCFVLHFYYLFPLQPPPGLPDHRYVHLTKADAVIIERWIDNKLGPTAARGQKDNLTTNRSEASHLTVLRGLPKCRNHLRNFTGRAKSAVHSMSIGVIDSVVAVNTSLRAYNEQNCPAHHTREQIRKRNAYHKKRKRSLSYKSAKFASKTRARQRRLFTANGHNGYQTGVQDPVVRLEHSYSTD